MLTPRRITIAQPTVLLVDPHACTDQSDALNVLRAVFDTLVRRGPDGEWLPAAARSWTVSADAQTYTFDLRDDLVFHDGTVLDTAAVEFSLRRMARPDMGATLGAGGVYAQYLAGLEVECLSRWRLVVRLPEALADFFDLLAYGHLVSPTAMATAGDDPAQRLVGSGPWRVTTINDGVAIEAEAFAHPWRSVGGASFVRWQAAPEVADRTDLIVQDKVEIATRLSSEALGNGVTVRTNRDPMAVVFLFNCSRGPLTDPRVRLALNLAIDRRALINEVLQGHGQPLHGFVSPLHFGSPPESEAAAQLPFNPDRARALLSAAGHAQGLQLDVDRPERLPDEAAALTDAVARQLAQVGVTFRIHAEPDRARYANRVRQKDIHDMALFDSSPLSTFRVLVEKIDSRFRGSWWQGYANPEVERVLDEARRTVDEASRRRLYNAAFVQLQLDPPWLYLYTHRRATGLTTAGQAWSVSIDDVLEP